MVCSEILQKHQSDENLKSFQHRLLVHPKGGKGSVYITQQEVGAVSVADLNFGHSELSWVRMLLRCATNLI